MAPRREETSVLGPPPEVPLAQIPPAVRERLPHLRERYGPANVEAQLSALARYGDAVEDPVFWLSLALERRFKFVPIERVPSCPCGSTKSLELYRFVFWNLLARRQCRECGLIFLSPRLTQASVNRIFDEHYFDPSDPDYWGKRRIPVFREVLKLLQRYECRTVFDVGAAYGHFVLWLRHRGIDAGGCDISRTAVEWGDRYLGIKLHHGSIITVPRELRSVDCVVSLDTLYYSVDPLAELRAMRQLLRPGGRVVLRLRNGAGALRQAKRRGRSRLSKDVIPSHHLWSFTTATIARLMTMCGLEPELFEPAAYSETRLHPILAWWSATNGFLSRRGFGIHTQSFNVVARRVS